ncbi:WzyE family oligosaccharide polymerase [Photobacterium damselae]|uniref:WzyE family oligosaccharide polymerase n=1 Tax=Photobacterium damselae TaxID=38293 RepID=UPI003C6E3AD0
MIIIESLAIVACATLILTFLLRNVGFSGCGIGGIFIYISHFLGYPLYLLRGEISEVYPKVSETIYHIGLIYSLVGFISYFLVVSFIKIDRDKKSNELSLSILKYQILLMMFYILFALGCFGYISKNGISFGGDYASRLTENSGSGFYLMAMFAFIPAIILLSLKNNIKQAYISAIICGLMYFFIVGGSRNILAAGLVAITFIAYQNGKLKVTRMLFLGVLVIIVMNMLVFARYSLSLANFDTNDIVALILSYTADSFSPLDFQSIAVNYYMTDYNPIIQGFNLFINQFSGFIPRFLWPDKPIVIMNNSYYFTTHILGLSGNLNMAPTMLGSSMVMFGRYGYFLVYIMGALFLKFIDIFTLSKVLILKVIGYMSIPFIFFMTREGLDLYVFIVFKFTLVVIFGFFISSIIYYIVPKKYETR